MKHCYNENEMQCMIFYDQKYKTHPKNFTITSSILKKPQIFKKSQKLGQMHELHEKEGLGPLPSEEKLDPG